MATRPAGSSGSGKGAEASVRRSPDKQQRSAAAAIRTSRPGPSPSRFHATPPAHVKLGPLIFRSSKIRLKSSSPSSLRSLYISCA